MPKDLAISAMSAMSVAEFALWAVIGFLFWKRSFYRRFPAMGGYLALRLASMPVLLALLYLQSQPWARSSSWGDRPYAVYFYGAYFYLYWGVYIASALLLFFVCMEVFRTVLSAFPGLIKFGIVIFRWTVLASAIVTFSSVPFSHRGPLMLADIGYGLMRSVSILELCLLTFLCLSMNALRLSVRDLTFGIALGFGVIASNDFLTVVLLANHTSLTAPWQFAYEAAILATLVMWVVYCALPERASKPVIVHANSTIYRWNEIASALGHTGTQVAVAQPANSFFLTDVEKVVEKVLSRNLKNSESEL